ncbi:hypothetical protein EV363DRAFT_1192066, partial [Boletus edulis]
VFADQRLQSMGIRFPDLLVTEEELRAAMSSVVLNMSIKVINWTAAIDDRLIPSTIRFFVELANEQGLLASQASILSFMKPILH